MSDYVIYTYGAVEQAAVIFNAIASITKDPSYNELLRSIFSVAAVIAIFEYGIKQVISKPVAIMVTFVLFTGILIYPKTTVIIRDNVALEDKAVGDVPIGLAVPASLITKISYAITSFMEQAYHLPDDQKYTKTGYLFASNLVRNTSQLQITDPEFKQSLKGYIKECVFYDVHLGSYSIKALLTTDNVWGLITDHPSPNRSFLLDNTIRTCKDGAKELNDKWKDINESTLDKYAKLLVPGVRYLQDGINIKPLVNSYIQSSFAHLTGLSRDSSSILRQVLLVNAIEDSAINNPELGMLSYAVAKANAQKTVSNFATSSMSSRWLPAMFSTIEFIIYGLFVVLVPLCLISGGIKAYLNYLYGLIWVVSWPIIYAILHFGSSWVLQAKCKGLGLSFYDLNNLTQIQYDTASIYAYFTNLVPFITGGVLLLSKGSLDSTFGQMAQLIGGSTQSLAMAASGEAVTGNLSMGNTNFNNSSLYNTSGFKHNTNMDYFSSTVSSQLPSGSVIRSQADGNSVLDMSSTISSMPISANYSDRLGEARSEQYEKVVGAGMNEQQNINTSASSISRTLQDIGSNVNHGTSIGESFRKNTSGGYAESAAELAQASERFAHDRNISAQEANRLLIGAYANVSGNVRWDSKSSGIGSVASFFTGASIGGQATLGAKGEYDKTTSSQLSKNQIAAMDFVKNNGLSNTIEHALRGVQENSYTADTREAQSLTNSLSSSYDKAVQASNNFSVHRQEAQNLRELSSYIKENSAGINYNASQELLHYIANQPLYSNQGPMGINQAEALIREKPAIAQDYAQRFISNKVKSEIDVWKNKVAYKESKYNSEISSKYSDVNTNHIANLSSMDNTTFATHKDNIKNNTIKSDTKSIIDNSYDKISSQKNHVNAKIRENSKNILEAIEGE